jgi:hypothetical protein
MPFLALLGNPLIRYAAAGLGMLLALWGAYSWAYGRGERAADERHAVEMQRFRDATVKLAEDRRAEIAARERANEELNTRLSKEVSDARQETDTAHAAYNRAVADKLRAQRNAGSCSAPGSPTPAGAAGSAELAAPTLQLDGQALVDLGNLASMADNTESVMKACKAWAISVGR